MKLFISYSDKDSKKMTSFEKAIQDSSLGLKPIIVAKDIKPGIPLSEKVKNAINDCDILIPIITKNSITNQWVNQEIGFAYAMDRKIFPLVDKSLLKELKGFIHSNLDIPFCFDSNVESKHKESYSYRKSYMDLLDYLSTIYQTIPIFNASISPIRVVKGNDYTTHVKFKGIVKNGFFDNFVRHQDSDWKTWNWDKKSILNTKPTTGGELHGEVNVESEYTWSTIDWPKGKHTIYVRIYDHPVENEKGRYVVAEEIKEIEII